MPVVQIPLHNQLAVPVDVYVTGAVVPDPRDEDVATTTDLRHQQMLPDMVTIHQGLGRGPGPATVHGSASRNGDEEARITFRKLTSRARLDERRVGVPPFLTHEREPVPTSRSACGTPKSSCGAKPGCPQGIGEFKWSSRQLGCWGQTVDVAWPRRGWPVRESCGAGR